MVKEYANKDVYMAAQVACCWTGAVKSLARLEIAEFPKEIIYYIQTEGRTDRPT